MVIRLFKFGKISNWIIEGICDEIYRIFENCEMAKKLRIPKSSYKEIRNQYRASDFIKIIQEQEGSIKLGVTDRDLYADSLNFVFGEAQFKGSAGIISINRLKPENINQNKNLLVERSSKEAIHEIGHMKGYEHCKNSDCVMNFSKNLKEVDNKGMSFCKECKYNP